MRAGGMECRPICSGSRGWRAGIVIAVALDFGNLGVRNRHKAFQRFQEVIEAALSAKRWLNDNLGRLAPDHATPLQAPAGIEQEDFLVFVIVCRMIQLDNHVQPVKLSPTARKNQMRDTERMASKYALLHQNSPYSRLIPEVTAAVGSNGDFESPASWGGQFGGAFGRHALYC